MSYITIPRLAFSGHFQADVSTVNNDVRHFDNATFEPRFQNKPRGPVQNGWYNPDGTGNFRLFGLQVKEALFEYGADPSSDPATGLFVNAQSERSSCKIVDLDPQMQAVSMLFGLRIVLTDGTNDYLSGHFTASAFRDLLNGRVAPSSAAYTSVLTDLEWSDQAQSSPTLMALKAAADQNSGKLSINLTPYNYGANQEGSLVGSIGAYVDGDPKTYVAGRRMANDDGLSKSFMGELMADVAGSVLSFDFSNAINLNSSLEPISIGTLNGAILRNGDTVTGLGTDAASVTVAVKSGATLSGSDIKLLDPITYLDGAFLDTHAAIADCQLDAEAQALIVDHPVAIVRTIGDDSYEVVIRETNGGLFTRADNFVLRMDPPITGAANEQVGFKVTQWGQPVSGVTMVTTKLGAARTGKYWGGGPPNEIDPPTATIPPINTPLSAFNVASGFVSGSDGWAMCPVSVTNPFNPRGYVDGQIYTASYHLGVGGVSPQAALLDLIVVHAREAQDYANPPSWEDIKPFMQQYDNLYPIMSRHLFSLADEAVFREHATLLTLAFSRPMNDSNHMPATRDLSSSKRQAVLNWLAQYTGQPAPIIDPPQSNVAVEVADIDTSMLPKPLPASISALEAMLANTPDDTMGKNPVMRGSLTAEIAELKKRDAS